jgi:hypothetical protein
MTPLAPPRWHDVVTRRGLRVLPHSTVVPIDVWLADPRVPSRVVRLLARGTTVRLLSYDSSDLSALLLRSECDCEEHRLAGAAGRLVLRPGAEPLDEASYDGAARHGWTGVAAARLRLDEVAPILEELWSASTGTRVAASA